MTQLQLFAPPSPPVYVWPLCIHGVLIDWNDIRNCPQCQTWVPER
jgi:hypothetical protein